jgi:hypothetical protein
MTVDRHVPVEREWKMARWLGQGPLHKFQPKIYRPLRRGPEVTICAVETGEEFGA